MTENVVNLVCVWLFKMILGCLKNLKKNEMRLSSNHPADYFMHNQELVSCSFSSQYVNSVSIKLFSLGICFIYNFIVLI